ncbi:MAG: sugar ABC transporter permease [Clostridiales bacterium]|nr:sugar ABC transporter permease [Clostridiales bacterium]MDY5514367.1 sugar ABC transporter permease [Candidatus Ventricola sp.]
MTRSRIAALLALAFIVLFCFSGVTATTTIDETQAVIQMGMPKLLFSLSSASILLIPLALCAMIAAVIALAQNERNIGMLFAGIGFVSFALFMVFFAREKVNSALYTPISEMLKELGVKFKKRDVKQIEVAYNAVTYLTLLCAAGATALSIPSFGRESRQLLKRDLLPYAYIGPHLFFFIIFFVTPAIYGIYAAFTKWDLFNEPVFTGLENFKTLLFDSSNTYYKQLRNGLANTFKSVIFSVPFCIILPLSLALALNARPKGNKFFQALYYLPSLMSISTVTLTWRYVFNVQYGIINKFFGVQANFFLPPYTWVMLVVVTVWWCTGGTMVIYQSALASVPQDQYEAAAVDGANSIQRFLHVTLPNMRYPLMYTLVTSVVAQFNIYGQPDILVGFSNAEANAVLLQYIYENSVKKQVAGMSSAMAVILGLCIMVVTFIQMRMMVRNNQD